MEQPPAPEPPAPDAAPGTRRRTPAATGRRRACRGGPTATSTARYVGGVAAGLARHLRLPRAVGAGGSSWPRWRRRASACCSTPALWLMLPADRRFDDEAPGLAAATRQGKRPGARRAARPRTAGRARRGRARARRAASPRSPAARCSLWPLAARGRRHRACSGGRPTRPSAPAGSTPPRRLGPLRALVGIGGWAAYGADPGRACVLLVGAIVLFSVRGGDFGRGPRRGGRGAAGRPRGRADGRAVAAAGSPPTSPRSGPSGSAARSAPTSPRTCTTRCCRRSR